MTNDEATVVVVEVDVEVVGAVVADVVDGVVDVVDAGAAMATEVEVTLGLAGNDVVVAAPSEEHANTSCEAMRTAAHDDRLVSFDPLNSA